MHVCYKCNFSWRLTERAAKTVTWLQFWSCWDKEIRRQNFIIIMRTNLTFIEPCIVIYFYSKTNQMHNISHLFYFGTTLCIYFLTLILLMWRIGWAPNNASKWQVGFNVAFKGLMRKSCDLMGPKILCNNLRSAILSLKFR